MTNHLNPDGTVRLDTDDDLAHLQQQQIDDCPQCDHNGYRGLRICDHLNHADIAKTHLAQIRAEMGWEPPTPPAAQTTPDTA